MFEVLALSTFGWIAGGIVFLCIWIALAGRQATDLLTASTHLCTRPFARFAGGQTTVVDCFSCECDPRDDRQDCGPCGRCDGDGAADARGGAVRDGPGHDGDEHGDRDGRQGHQHDGDGDPDGDHDVRAGDGLADDHRREGRGDRRAQARVHDRLRGLRVRVADDGALAEPADAAVRVVAAGGPGRGADHAGDRGARRGELRQARAPARVWADHGRRGDRRRAGPADRRLLHDVLLVALRVRRGGPDRRRDPRARAPRERHARGGGREARPVRHAAVGAGPGHDRVRDPEVRHLGRRAAQARGAAVARAVPGDLADPRRPGRAGVVPALGDAADRARGGRAARSQAAAQTCSCAPG